MENQAQAQERLFLINETGLNQLLGAIKELPFRVADPIIKFISTSFQEVKPEQVKEPQAELVSKGD